MIYRCSNIRKVILYERFMVYICFYKFEEIRVDIGWKGLEVRNVILV